jgi:intracellular multiplication protein IcmP
MSGNNNQGDPTILLMVVILFLWGICWLIWHFSHVFWLDHVFRYVRLVEMWPLSLFNSRYEPCITWLQHAQFGLMPAPPGMLAATNACFGTEYLSTLPIDELSSYYSLSVPPIMALGDLAMYYYRWPLSGILLWIGIYVLMYSPQTKFMTKHTLESLIEAQSKMWPIISPIVKFNPSKTGRILGDMVPDKLPMFAEALSPEEWVAWNRIPVVNGIPDRDAARRAFVRQLGPRWNGINSAPPYMQGLLAAFAAKGAQKRDESDELLGRLALAWSPNGGFRMDRKLAADVDKILRDPEMGGRIKTIADQYAWRTTAMLGVLRWGRANGGVLAPASFIWVRAQDRALWYPLNNLGRRSFHSEGAGAMAHFMAEEAAKKPLPIPRVDTAIVTLNTYLHDPDKKTIPIPPREGVKT